MSKKFRFLVAVSVIVASLVAVVFVFSRPSVQASQGVPESIALDVVAAPNATNTPRPTRLPRANPLKRYLAICTQTGTAAPVCNVLQNQFRSPLVWSRVAQGLYAVTLADAFPETKTYATATVSHIDSVSERVAVLVRNTSSQYYLKYDYAGSSDDMPTTYVEILVYR